MKTKETRAEELARTITELGLEPYIQEIDEQGYTVVPPSITGVTEEQVDQLTQLLLDESEKYVGCKFTVEGGSECELDYGDFPGAIEQISGVKPAQFMMVQLCKIHRAFRDLAVNPAAIAIVNHRLFRNQNRLFMGVGDNAHIDKKAGPQILKMIAYPDRHLKGPAARIDHRTDTLDPTFEAFIGQKFRGDNALLAVVDGRQILTGNEDAGDHIVEFDQIVELAPRAHPGADLHVALGDHAGKRRQNCRVL